jgi:ribonucleoside-diphosphate reductase alpha chain
MQTYSPYRVRSVQPEFLEKLEQPIAESTKGWTVRKRDGSIVAFDIEKIKAALLRCFNNVVSEQNVAMPDVDPILEYVVLGLITRNAAGPIDVEEIQRTIIAQLWITSLSEFAEHYQNYREDRRRARLNRPVPTAYASAVSEDRTHFQTDLQYYQFIGKFSRWNDTEKRRETWKETVFNRVIPWFQNLPKVKNKLTQDEWDMLSKSMYQLEASPAMRVVQMAGPALERCHVGVYNCAYAPITDLRSFAELLYVLMQGTGMGFSVEYDQISTLPRIAKQTGELPISVVVEDSTEGWCDALFHCLEFLFQGRDFILDTSAVRPKGTRLKTKGGRASGPEPFHELMTFIRRIVLSRQTRHLSDIDVHDICCMIGNIVQVGGVRRAALISLSDLGSHEMRSAKSGQWYIDNKHRSMANNSAVYHSKPSTDVFMDEWLSLIRSYSGERGICNRQAMDMQAPERRQKGYDWGFNPCGEIQLRPYEFCNLSIAVARPDDTETTLMKKVLVATYFGTMQATCTRFNYIRDQWRRNCEEEALLGVDITGHADCPLLHPSHPGRPELLRKLKAVVNETNEALTRRFGISRSAADTCIKPGGDSSVFFDCASGVSPRYADRQIRWVRESKHSPVAKFLIDQGVPYHDSPERPNDLYVFGFPKTAPDGCLTRNSMTAIEQLENWLCWKRNWAEHSVSATIYVEPYEWFQVGSWVYDHFDEITGLSFLPKDNGVYKHAPNEELTADQYAMFSKDFPVVDWSKLCQYEDDDQTESAQNYACVGGACAF